MLGAADAGHDHVQVVQAVGVCLGQGAGKEVRLLLVIAFEHHAVAGGDQHFEGFDDPLAGQDRAIGEVAHPVEAALLFGAPARPLRRGRRSCCHGGSTRSAVVGPP
ncbi:hypothetical protein FQZ97_1112650 [compost metagenome]